MAEADSEYELREAAYFIWEREGRPDGRAYEHWMRAIAEHSGAGDDLADEEEKLFAGRSDVNLPALLTKDVPGG